MASRTYQNFDLLLEDEGAGTFRARVTTSPSGRVPERQVHAPVRRDAAGEPAAQAGPRSQRHPPRRFGPAEPGVDGPRRAAVRGGVLRGHHAGLAALPGLRPRRGRRAPAPAAAHRRAGHRRPAVGAALRPPRQQLHRAVRAHPGRPLPRGATAAPAADGRRCAAHPRGHLVADRPARARRRGRVAPGAGRPRHQGRRGHGEDRPAPAPTIQALSALVAAERRPHPALHRPRRLRRPDPGRRHLLPGPLRPQHQGEPHRPRSLPARPRPAAPGAPQRLPVGPRRLHRPVQRDGPGSRPAGLHRRRGDAVPDLRRRGHGVHRRVLRRPRRRVPGRPGRHQRTQGAHRRVCGGVGDAGALPARPRRPGVRPHRRPAGGHRGAHSGTGGPGRGRGARPHGSRHGRDDHGDDAQAGRRAGRARREGRDDGAGRPHGRGVVDPADADDTGADARTVAGTDDAADDRAERTGIPTAGVCTAPLPPAAADVPTATAAGPAEPAATALRRPGAEAA